MLNSKYLYTLFEANDIYLTSPFVYYLPWKKLEKMYFSTWYKFIDNNFFIIGEKPMYKCQLCPATCGRKADLRVHVQKLHTSDKPLQCNMCDKSFPDR